MRPVGVILALGMLLSVGAGCSVPKLPTWSIFPDELDATSLALAPESTITLEQSTLNPLERLAKQPQRVVSLTTWVPNESVELTWDETFERETAASITARHEAERASGVGDPVNVPEPVYETISLQGAIKTDALNDGQRISLPSEWSETIMDLTGGSSTVIWLSKTQYEELAATRHTHLAIGVFDSGLQTAADAATAIKGLIAGLQSGGESNPIVDADVTEIVASADWGSYTVKFNGQKSTVRTIQAENQFASYTILANPENPLILEVELKAWAYGTEALGFVSDDLKISGYSVIEINTPSTLAGE
jgi:hypothetical protein